MKKIFFLLIFLTFLFSCKHEKENIKSTVSKNETNIKVLDENKDFVIFINPTVQYLDSLKKSYKNEDDFYIIADDANYYTAEAGEYISKNNIDTIDLPIDKTIKIGKIKIKLSQYKPWTLLLYKSGHVRNVFPINIQDELPKFYGIKNTVTPEK